MNEDSTIAATAIPGAAPQEFQLADSFPTETRLTSDRDSRWKRSRVSDTSPPGKRMGERVSPNSSPGIASVPLGMTPKLDPLLLLSENVSTGNLPPQETKQKDDRAAQLRKSNAATQPWAPTCQAAFSSQLLT